MRPETKPSTVTPLLYSFLHGHRTGFVCSVLLAAATAVINAACMLMLIPLLDRMTSTTGNAAAPYLLTKLRDGGMPVSDSPLSLSAILLVYVVLAVMLGVVQMSRTLLDGRLAHSFCFALRSRLYDAVCHADWVTQSGLRQSDLAHALVSESDRVQRGTSAGLTLVGNLVLAVSLLAVSLFVQPVMALLTLSCAAALFPLLYIPNRRSRKAGQLYSQRCRAFFQDSLNQLAGLKESKVLGSEDRHLKHFCDRALGLRDTGIQQQRALGLTNLIFAVSGAVVVCTIFLLGATWLRSPLPQLSVVLLAFLRLAPRLRTMQIQYQLMITAAPAFETITELGQRLHRAREQQTSAEQDSFGDVQTAVELLNVRFQYPGSTTAAVEQFSARIPAHSLVAITGPSGSGKSTLIDLLTGLLQPDAGTITVDGTDLRNVSPAGWRNTFGYVPQQPFLIDGSIEENLRWARPDATLQQLQAALAKADLNQFSDEQGLQHSVGERGVKLSGGERQRLTLARALLRCPSLLVLDEPTSSLDPSSARRIWQTLVSLSAEMTIVVVTHQTQYCHLADTVLRLHRGRLQEAGPPPVDIPTNEDSGAFAA